MAEKPEMEEDSIYDKLWWFCIFNIYIYIKTIV